jgi:hypothetical protein
MRKLKKTEIASFLLAPRDVFARATNALRAQQSNFDRIVTVLQELFTKGILVAHLLIAASIFRSVQRAGIHDK